jgi:hypothetical protein
MSKPKPFRIFVSYSHYDAALVRPVVQLLRATRGGLVFQDADSLRVGRPWRPQIRKAVKAAHLVAVFWCAHSATSDEVRKEYEEGLAHRKDLMPILFDSTPLPEPLGAFHGIDFRALGEMAHKRGGLHYEPPQTGLRLLWEQVVWTWVLLWHRRRLRELEQRRLRAEMRRGLPELLVIADELQTELLRRRDSHDPRDVRAHD